MFTIARYTFVEYLRRKIVYVILGIGAVLMLCTVLAGSLALSEQIKVIRDFGLGLIEIAGLILVLFFGSSVLQQEITNNTIFLIASKNIKRSNVILGKFIGFSGIILFFIVLLGILYTGTALLYHVPLLGIHYLALGGMAIKLEVLLSLCLFFASFVSPFVALAASLVIYLLGHLMSFVVFYVTILKKDMFSPLFAMLTKLIYYIVPNFTALSVQDFFDVPFLYSKLPQSFGFAVLFHIFYIVVILFLAVRIFNKKQF